MHFSCTEGCTDIVLTLYHRNRNAKCNRGQVQNPQYDTLCPGMSYMLLNIYIYTPLQQDSFISYIAKEDDIIYTHAWETNKAAITITVLEGM